MSNGKKPQGITPEQYGQLVGSVLARQASLGMYRDPVAERAGASPFETLGKYDEGATAALYQPANGIDPKKVQQYYRADNQSW